MKEIDRRVLIGVSFIFFGLLYFLREIGAIDDDSVLMEPKMFPLYLTVIFFAGKDFKFATVGAVVSLVVWFPLIASKLGHLAHILWPLIFVAIGGAIIYVVRRDKMKKEENERLNEGDISDAEEVK